MASIINPFNVKLLQLSESATRNMAAIRILDSFDGATKNFHPQGLFSNEIFGPNGDKQRMRRFAYIDVKLPILHPLVFRVLGKLKRIYTEIMAGKTYATWDTNLQDFVKSDPVDGDTGFNYFMSHFDDIKLPQRLSDLRELNIKFIERTRAVATTTRVIVAPAGFRDYTIMADGREEEDEVNKLYRKLIASANAVALEMFKMSPKTYDRVRYSMQVSFNGLYEYYENMIKGKHKLMLGRVMTRQVRDGTRNVITTQNLDVKELFGAGTPTTNSTGIGLFQFIKAYRPMCLWHIQNGFLKNVFRSPGVPARLVNSNNLHAEEAQLPLESYDLWMTKEGVEKLFNLFAEEERRHKPVVVDGYYLALIYNDGKVFKIFQDIDDLPAGWDRQHVKPITFAEFIYTQVFGIEGHVTMNVTRFPVTGFGSTYPTIPFLKVTTRSQNLVPLDDYWQKQEGVPTAREFPVRGEAFVNTLMPAPDKLAGATADFDGDKMSALGVITKEAVAESKEVMTSRNFHVRTNGDIAHSLGTDTVNFLFGALTSVPVVTDELRAKYMTAKPATENIDSQDGVAYNDSIYLGGSEYSKSVLFKNINKHDQPVVKLPRSLMGYARSDMRVSQQAIDKAKSSDALLVLRHSDSDQNNHYTVLSNFAALIKANSEKTETINAYVVSEHDMRSAKMMPEMA